MRFARTKNGKNRKNNKNNFLKPQPRVEIALWAFLIAKQMKNTRGKPPQLMFMEKMKMMIFSFRSAD